MKNFLRAIAFLLLLFVVLYIGMNNTHDIVFNFPIAGTTAKDPIHASAAFLYFGMFAIGVLAGMALLGGGGKKSSGDGGSKKK